MPKYRGKVIVTFELLQELLKLDGSTITNIVRTERDLSYDTVTLFLSSDKLTKHTFEMVEGGEIPRTIIDK